MEQGSKEQRDMTTTSKNKKKTRKRNNHKNSASSEETEVVHVASLCTEDGRLIEMVYNPPSVPPLRFNVFEGNKRKTTNSLTIDGKRILPVADRTGMVEKGVVVLPSRAANYGSQGKLVTELTTFIHRYVDVPDFWEELIAHYVLMTWVFDRFTAVPYLRFLGEYGTGKTRFLQVSGHLCYKAIIAGGAITASPLFRLIEIWRGTFVLDEADFKNSDAWAEIIKILNSGYMRGIAVLRSEKVGERYEPRAYDVFGPKILANRSRFEDSALESRCITLETVERSVRADIPLQMPHEFYREARELRNKLLMWRFKNYDRIRADESKLRHLEPRLSQIGTPIYSVSCDPGFRARLIAFLGEYSAEERSHRPQAAVVEAIRRQVEVDAVLKQPGWNLLSVKGVAEEAKKVAESWGNGVLLSPKRVGGIIRSLGFTTERERDGYKFVVDEGRLAQLTKKYGPNTV